MLDACEDHQLSPEFGHEEFVAVRYNFQREAVFTVPIFKEKDRTGLSCQCSFGRNDTDVGVEVVCDG